MKSKRSIFTKLLVTYITLSTVSTLLIGSIAYYIASYVYSRQIENDQAVLLKQYAELVETKIINETTSLFMDLLLNKEYEELTDFFHATTDSGKILKYNKELKNKLTKSNELIRDIFLYNFADQLILSAEEGLIVLDSRDSEWWAISQESFEGWGVLMDDNGLHSLRYAHKYPVMSSAPMKGYFVIDVRKEAMMNLLDEITASHGGELLILDNKNKVIPLKQEFSSLEFKEFDFSQNGGGELIALEGKEVYMTYSPALSNEWRLILLTPINDFYASLTFMQKSIIVVTIISVFVGILVSVIFSRYFYFPVKDIVQKLLKNSEKHEGYLGNEYEFIDREIFHLNNTVDDLEGIVKSYYPMIEYNIITGLINKTLNSREAVRNSMLLLNDSGRENNFKVVILKINDLIFEIMDDKNLQFFIIQLINQLKQIGNGGNIASHYKTNEIVAIMYIDDNDIQNKVIENKFKSLPVGAVSIGIGGSYKDIMDFHYSYSQAQEALEYFYFNAGVMVYDYHVFSQLSTPENDDMKELNVEFSQKLKEKDVSGAIAVVKDIEQYVQSFPFHYDYMNLKLLEMVRVFAEYCRTMNIKLAVENLEVHFQQTKNVLDFFELFREMIKNALGSETNTTENKKEKFIQSVCEYIEAHFSEDISISDIAEAFNVSDGYLSRAFKQVKEQSVIEYISEKRIENARALLLERDLPIEQIAQLSGYRTHHYFTKKFKEKFGCTPTQYRDRFGGFYG